MFIKVHESLLSRSDLQIDVLSCAFGGWDGSDMGWDTMRAKIHIQILLALPYKSTLIKGALSNAEFSEAVFCVKTNQQQLVNV